MRELAGLRNLLVHVYTEVDDALIYESVRSETVDFGVFAAQVLDYVDANSHP